MTDISYRYTVSPMYAYPQYPRTHLKTKYGPIKLEPVWGQANVPHPHEVAIRAEWVIDNRAVGVEAHAELTENPYTVVLGEIRIHRPNTRPPKVEQQEEIEQVLVNALKDFWNNKAARTLYLSGYRDARDISDHDCQIKMKPALEEKLKLLKSDLKQLGGKARRAKARLERLKAKPLPETVSITF